MEVIVCGGYCLGECPCVGAEPMAFPWLRDCDAPGYLDRACSSIKLHSGYFAGTEIICEIPAFVQGH